MYAAGKPRVGVFRPDRAGFSARGRRFLALLVFCVFIVQIVHALDADEVVHFVAEIDCNTLPVHRADFGRAFFAFDEREADQRIEFITVVLIAEQAIPALGGDDLKNLAGRHRAAPFVGEQAGYAAYMTAPCRNREDIHMMVSLA